MVNRQPLLKHNYERRIKKDAFLSKFMYFSRIKAFHFTHQISVCRERLADRYPLFIRMAVKCVEYWLKLTRLQTEQADLQNAPSRTLCQVYWVSQIQRIPTENCFRIVWLCQRVGYEMRFVSTFMDRLISCYKQNCKSEIESSE